MIMPDNITYKQFKSIQVTKIIYTYSYSLGQNDNNHYINVTHCANMHNDKIGKVGVC